MEQGARSLVTPFPACKFKNISAYLTILAGYLHALEALSAYYAGMRKCINIRGKGKYHGKKFHNTCINNRKLQKLQACLSQEGSTL